MINPIEEVTTLSSVVNKMKYYYFTKKLIINFKTGISYEYNNVPVSLWDKFRVSESKGKFMNSYVVGKFKFKTNSWS